MTRNKKCKTTGFANIQVGGTAANILIGFFPETEEKTSKDVEKKTGISHESIFRNLKTLVKGGYLKKRKVGKTNVYKFILNDKSYLTFVHYMTKKLEKFKKNHGLLYKRLKEFTSTINSQTVILFGSYAKGTETKQSDIDILVVSNEKTIEKTARIFKTKYNISIKPVVIKTNDFKNIRKDNPEFYKDLIKFGIVFYGTEYFFQEVYFNDKNN